MVQLCAELAVFKIAFSSIVNANNVNPIGFRRYHYTIAELLLRFLNNAFEYFLLRTGHNIIALVGRRRIQVV